MAVFRTDRSRDLISDCAQPLLIRQIGFHQTHELSLRRDAEPAEYGVARNDRELQQSGTRMWSPVLHYRGHLLNELFAPSSYSIRFQKLRIHAVVHNYRSGTKNSGIVVNVTNVFSPSVHITFEQVLGELNNLPLSASERAIAGEYLQELEGETKGEKRWPIIARSLEGMKALGKGVYEKVALPLLVEFLKRQIDPR